MRKLTSREVFLILVVAALAILGWVYGRGGHLGGGAGAAEELGELSFGDPPVVELARLGLQPDDYNSNARNLFRYYTPPPPPRVAAPPVQRQAPPPRTAAPPVKPQTPRTLAPPVQQAPRPGFRYIGFMGPKDNKIAVLEKGDDVILAAVGEVVDQHFVIREFKYETLVIGYTAERWADEQTELPMKR